MHTPAPMTRQNRDPQAHEAAAQSSTLSMRKTAPKRLTGAGFAAFVALGLCASVAPAADAAQPDAPRSIAVSYGELDLDRPEGAKVLYQRLKSAARKVCGMPHPFELERGRVWRECYESTLADAVRKVGRPMVVELHRARPRNTLIG